MTGTRGRVLGGGLGSLGHLGGGSLGCHTIIINPEQLGISVPLAHLASHEEAKKPYQSHFIASVLNIYLMPKKKKEEKEKKKIFNENKW